MLILLHIIYLYTEYLWSYIVNRNRLLDEPDENETNCVEYERNNEFGASRDNKNIVSSSVEDLLKANDGAPSDNLEFDGESSDRFSFSDNVEEFEDAVYDVDTKKLSFFPPVYVQRYVTVINILKDERWRNEIKKVVDIGCAELGFFKFLKDIDSLEKIIEIDIDKKLLQQYSYRIQPWVSDYLKDRNSPLDVTLLCGNVTRPDRHLEGVDAVVAIELIEHLFPPDLDALPFNIFGVVKPRIAIFTTPNEEFNVLFDNFSGFRHYDHKFEWNRGEFESWANNICSRFPCYEVNFFGVGPGPKGNDSLGCCSQGCVFIRTFLPKENCFTKPLNNYVEYEVIDRIDYPYRRDSRSQDKITLDDAENFINLAVRIGDYTNGNRIEIPLGVIFMRVYKTCKSSDKLKQILEESGYEIEKDKDGDFIVIVPESCFDSDTDSDNQSEFKEESIQHVDYVEGENGLISDWDGVEQDCVSWVTDDIPNDFNNICSNQLISDKESSDYKSEQLVALDGDTCIGDGVEGLPNNSHHLDKNLKLDNNGSEFSLDSYKSLDDLSLNKLECNLGKNIFNSDNIPQQISQEFIDMNTDFDCLKTTYSTADECLDRLKHSGKFLSSEECMSYDMSEIKETCSDNSNDLSVLQVTKSVLKNFGEEDKEIKSVQFNCENLISGNGSGNENPAVSYSCPGKGDGSFHEVTDSKNLDAMNISSPKSNLVQNIHNGDYLGVCNLEVMSDSKHDKNPALLLNDNLTESNSSQLSVGNSLKLPVPLFRSEIEHCNCKDPLFSKITNDKINNGNLSVDSVYAVDECIEGVQEVIKELNKCSVVTENDSLVKSNVLMTSDDLCGFVEKETVCLGMKSSGRDNNKTDCTNSFASAKSESSHLSSGKSSSTAKNYESSRNGSRKCIDVISKDDGNHITGLKYKCDTFLTSKVLADSCQCDQLDLNKKSNLSDSNSISDNHTNIGKVLFCDFKSKPSILDPDKEAASSFMRSERSLDSDNKSSETAANYRNGKLYNDFLSMPSNLTPSQLDSNNTNNIRMFDELINSDVPNDKKIPSDLSLCIDKNSEKVIKTHNFETDENDCSTDFAADEVHLNSEPNTFNVCEKNYDRMSKSHSLSHFLENSSPLNDECNSFMNPIKNSSKDVAFFPSSSPADYQKLHQKLTERFDEKKPLNEKCQEEEDDDNDESLKDFLHAGMERQDSFSPDKAVDSGYPNSNSGRDMEMDLTPEQVKEIMTEGESSLENSPPDSPVEEAAVAIIPHPPILHLGDNVENGDVANNNRDGEGNNMVGQAAIVGEPLEFHAVIDQDQEVPLMAVAEFIGRNERIDHKSENRSSKCSENDLVSKNENEENPEADAQKKEGLNSSTSICVPNSSSSVSDDRHGMIKRSKTFLDKPSTFKSIADKGNSETNSSSCPDSSLKLIDETEISCVTYSNNLSHSSITNWESFKMVESNDVRELRRYASWLAEKSSLFSRDNSIDFSASAAEDFSVLQTDSVPSCSFSNRSYTVSSLPQTDISPLHHPPSVASVSEAHLTLPEVIAMPFEIFDEMLDSVIQDIVEEFLSPNLVEPFADWLLQIQLEIIDGEGNDGDRFQNNANRGLRALDEGNNTSDLVLTVQADVKGGGDSSIDQ